MADILRGILRLGERRMPIGVSDGVLRQEPFNERRDDHPIHEGGEIRRLVCSQEHRHPIRSGHLDTPFGMSLV